MGRKLTSFICISFIVAVFSSSGVLAESGDIMGNITPEGQTSLSGALSNVAGQLTEIAEDEMVSALTDGAAEMFDDIGTRGANLASGMLSAGANALEYSDTYNSRYAESMAVPGTTPTQAHIDAIADVTVTGMGQFVGVIGGKPGQVLAGMFTDAFNDWFHSTERVHHTTFMSNPAVANTEPVEGFSEHSACSEVQDNEEGCACGVDADNNGVDDG